MASVPLEKFLPFVVPEVLGVPEPVALDAVRNACFDFCKRSFWWTERLDAEPYSAGEGVYQLLPPSGAVFISVLSLNLDGQRSVAASTLEDVDRGAPDMWARTGEVQTFVQPAPDTVQLIPAPNKAGVFSCVAAFAPSRTALSVPDGLLTYYLETIAHGALSKIKRVPNMPWTDPSGAAYYDRLFWEGVNSALLDRNRGPARSEMRVALRPFV